MHQTRITREQVYRAVMARARQCAIQAPPLALSVTNPDTWIEQSKEWEQREFDASLVTLRLMGDILNTLAEEMDIDIDAIHGTK